MSKDPAFLFYSSDFMAGTYTMSNEQVGKYIRLLCLIHQRPDHALTEKDMLNICETYDEDIFCKFSKQEGKYTNERLKSEIDRRKRYSESRSENRKSLKNKELKKEEENNICSTYDQHMETETETINTSFYLNIKDSKIKISEMPTWKEKIQKAYKLSIDQVEKYISDFFNELTLKGENPVRSIQQTQSHFINWLKIQLEKNPASKLPITTSHKRVTREEQLRLNEEYSKQSGR